MSNEKDVAVKTEPVTLNSLVSRSDIRKRFEEMLQDRAAGFLSSLLSLQNANQQLKEAEPWSIVQAAAIAATLDLPINQNLGRAYIIPYRQKEGPSVAQFQMGWKGFVELAIRTGQYKTINTTEVYKDEIARWDPLSGIFEATPWESWKLREKGDFRDIAGYMACFKLLSGFEKTLYMTDHQAMAHGKRYSKSFDRPSGLWMTNPHAMKLKTVVKLLLSKWGVLSIQMQKAMEVDQAVIETAGTIDTETVSYPDRPETEAVVSKPSGSEKKINQDQFKLLRARMDKSGIHEDAVYAWLQKEFAKEHLHDLTVEELSQTIRWLEQEPPAEVKP